MALNAKHVSEMHPLSPLTSASEEIERSLLWSVSRSVVSTSRCLISLLILQLACYIILLRTRNVRGNIWVEHAPLHTISPWINGEHRLRRVLCSPLIQGEMALTKTAQVCIWVCVAYVCVWLCAFTYMPLFIYAGCTCMYMYTCARMDGRMCTCRPYAQPRPTKKYNIHLK